VNGETAFFNGEGKAKMIRSILVATDLTEASDPVVRAASALVGVAGAELHVVHALELPVLPYSGPDRAVAQIEGRRAAAEEGVLEQCARAAPNAAPAASVEVVAGPVYAAVLERADAVDADLIVLGPHRLRPFADRLIGSTADRVIRTSHVPCLLVRGAFDLPLRRVMVPTDLSDASNAAIEVALRWAGSLGAADSGAAVQVMHIVPRAYEMPDFAFDEEVIAPELDRLVAEAVERASHSGTVEPRVSWGNLPADEILGAAARERIDLLVVATHGHGAVRRALLGSVASSIARGAPCPLLLVPPSAGEFSHER